MADRPERLVQELVKKVITLVQLSVAEAIASSAGINIDDGTMSRVTEEAEALIKKIVSRMTIDAEV